MHDWNNFYFKGFHALLAEIKDINKNFLRRLIMAEATETDFYDKVFPVPDRVREKSYIKSRAEYDKLYKESDYRPQCFLAKNGFRKTELV